MLLAEPNHGEDSQAGGSLVHDTVGHQSSQYSEALSIAKTGTEVCSQPSGVIMTHTQTLTTELSRDVRRGCPTHLAMRQFGKIWGGSAGKEEDYLMSQEVERIDDFLSHDWKTGRYAKFSALCLVYNSKAAVIASISVAALAGVLQLDATGVLPTSSSLRPPVDEIIAGRSTAIQAGFWCMTLSLGTFIVFFLFWQRMRNIFCLRPIMCFVDKLCIHQTCSTKKQAGIDGLAGFLDVSNRLVIMWSPRYFTRLWCVYELASWLYLDRYLQKALVFLPVAESTVYMIMFLYQLICSCATMFLSHTPFYTLAIPVLSITTITVVVHMLRRFVHDLRRLPLQIQEFKAQTSECFCCTVGHVLPGTQIQLSCDREKVFGTLKVWHDSVLEQLGPERAAEVEADYLEAFNHNVRTKFSAAVMRTVGDFSLNYTYNILTSLPWIWFAFDALTVFDTGGLVDGIRYWAYLISVPFCINPFILAFFFKMAFYVDKKIGMIKNRFLDVLMTLLLGLVAGLMFSILLFAMKWCSRRESPVPQLVLSFVYIIVTASMFPGSFLKKRTTMPMSDTDDMTGRVSIIPKVRISSSIFRGSPSFRSFRSSQVSEVSSTESEKSLPPSLLSRNNNSEGDSGKHPTKGSSEVDTCDSETMAHEEPMGQSNQSQQERAEEVCIEV